MNEMTVVEYESGAETEAEELDALGYLQGVYRGRIIAETPRMKAAIAALPFEKPKLAVSVNTDATGFAWQMEEMARRSGKSNVIDAKARYDMSAPLKIDRRPEPISTDPSQGGFKRRF